MESVPNFSREPDEKLATYLRTTYGPYRKPRAMNGTEAVPCDLCGLKVNSWILVEAREGCHGTLMVCRVNKCLELVLDDETARKLRVPLAGTGTERWGTPAAGLDLSASEAEDAEEAVLAADPALAKDLVAKAHNFLKAGYGKHWRVVPNVVKFYEDRGRITPRQLAVLERFVHSCKHEAGV